GTENHAPGLLFRGEPSVIPVTAPIVPHGPDHRLPGGLPEKLQSPRFGGIPHQRALPSVALQHIGMGMAMGTAITSTYHRVSGLGMFQELPSRGAAAAVMGYLQNTQGPGQLTLPQQSPLHLSLYVTGQQDPFIPVFNGQDAR